MIDVDHDRDQIVDAVSSQISNGRYSSEPIYGNGDAGKKIAEVLASVEVTIQKRLSY